MKKKIIFPLIFNLALSSGAFADINSDKSHGNIFAKLKSMPSLQARDGNITFTIDGRLQMDAGAISKGRTGNKDSKISIRRSWLGASGNVTPDWNYRLLIGFENNQTSVLDAFVKYNGLENANILIGNIFENNGISNESGNLVMPLMERASGITTFRQLRRTGISINPHGANWGGQFGLFKSNPTNSTTSAINANNKGSGISTRFHATPINDKNNSEFLHLGINSTYRKLDGGANSTTNSNKTMRFSSRGNSNIVNIALIDTGNILGVSNYYQNMGELRYQKGALTLTSEYIQTRINRTGRSLNFSGGYLMASYFLTGEHYGYSAQSGLQTLANIKKNAWEIASRYSTTNLNNKEIRGGKLDSYDFGVNYYPNSNVKLMINYIFNRTDSAALAQNNPQYIMARAQVYF